MQIVRRKKTLAKILKNGIIKGKKNSPTEEIMERKFTNHNTYCNPLPVPECPRGTDGWLMMNPTGEPQIDYRSISDPSVLYHDGKWYLYPSYGMAFVSEDFATWKHVRTKPYDMKYSPVVVPFRGRYLMTSHSHGLYIADSPLGDFEYLGDFITPSGELIRPTDPALFVDDDGRLYLYCFGMRAGSHKRSFITGTFGVELDPDNPRKFLTELKCLFEYDPSHVWERFGEKRQDNLCGWIEGQWMYKKNGRYYLVYATSGTEYTNYCMAAYYSDEGPLDGFVIQKNNPIIESKSKLVSGAGHGCVVDGPNGTIWAFYTISVACVHIYERLIGMDEIAIDENGELYAPHGVTDTPQYAPGVCGTSVVSNATGLYPLTVRQRGQVVASSAAPGRNGFYALDESLLTYWQPADGDECPTLTVGLQAPYHVQAARILWRDIGLDYENGVVPGAYRYTLEGRPDADRDEWVTLIDARESAPETNVTYETFEPVSVEAVRLKVYGWPEGIRPAVMDFTVFGIRDETV